jgi:hypothetical protein
MRCCAAGWSWSSGDSTMTRSPGFEHRPRRMTGKACDRPVPTWVRRRFSAEGVSSETEDVRPPGFERRAEEPQGAGVREDVGLLVAAREERLGDVLAHGAEERAEVRAALRVESSREIAEGAQVEDRAGAVGNQSTTVNQRRRPRVTKDVETDILPGRRHLRPLQHSKLRGDRLEGALLVIDAGLDSLDLRDIILRAFRFSQRQRHVRLDLAAPTRHPDREPARIALSRVIQRLPEAPDVGPLTGEPEVDVDRLLLGLDQRQERMDHRALARAVRPRQHREGA